MEDKIFDLEQSIMQCWNVCDDIDLVYSQTMNHSTPLTQDEMANILLGMKSLYNMKFEKCLSDLEDVCEEYWKNKKLSKQDKIA